MFPSLSALGAANRGIGGHMASPVTLNGPGGPNAQRGYQNASGGLSYHGNMALNPGPGAPGPLSYHQNMALYPALQQWLTQYAGA